MKFSLVHLRLKKLLLIFSSFRLIKCFFINGVFAAVEHRPIFLNNLRTIVDVGANKGQFSLAARKFSPNAEVYSFEPLPVPFEILKKIFIKDSKVRVYKCAVGIKAERLPMHLSAHEDSSSLLAIAPAQNLNFPGTQEVGLIDIDVAPLNYHLDSKDILAPALLKIDVQGYEFEVLIGSEDLLGSFSLIYCECSFVELYKNQKLAHEVIHWLSERNFSLIGVFNMSYTTTGQAVQADFLFKNLSI